MDLIVDYVGFEDVHGRMVIKELAIVERKGKRLAHFVFKNPYDWNELDETAKAVNTRLTSHQHGIRWDEGGIDHADVAKVVGRALERSKSLYAYGTSKCSVLQKLTKRTFINLETEFNAPPPKKIGFEGVRCMLACHHVPYFECALENASILARWLRYYSDRLKTNRICSIPSGTNSPLTSSLPGEC